MKVLKGTGRIRSHNAEALFVLHDEAELVRAGMLKDLEVPFPVLIDVARQAYRDWGLGRAPPIQTYVSPRHVLGYARMLLGGERLHRPGKDTLQLGGDFVVGPDGVIRYSHPQSAADDRPPVGLLLRHLENAAQNST